MNDSRFLKALLGDDCTGALVEAARRTPGLEAALTPRAMVAWLAALGPQYSGAIPGLAGGSLNFQRTDGLYKGEVILDDQTFSYRDAPGLEVAALLSVVAGEETSASKVRVKDLIRLGKTLDKMVRAVIENQQRDLARGYLAKADRVVEDIG
jgi:hypothetical protein